MLHNVFLVILVVIPVSGILLPIVQVVCIINILAKGPVLIARHPVVLVLSHPQIVLVVPQVYI